MSDDVIRGRDSFGRRAWEQAFEELSAAETQHDLDVADVERLAICAYLIGRADESARAWERAYLAHVRRRGDRGRCPLHLLGCVRSAESGRIGRGSGWVHRGRRLLHAGDIDCVELGYLGYVDSLRRVVEGDVDGAVTGFAAAAVTGDRFGRRNWWRWRGWVRVAA